MNIFLIHLVYSPNIWGELLPRILVVFTYIGPETVLPLASILAAVLGFLLIFWRVIINFFKKVFKRTKVDQVEADQSPERSDNYIDPLDDQQK